MNEHGQKHERNRPSPVGAISAFDYDFFDEQTKAFLEQKTNETHGLLKRTAANIHTIGTNLRSVQQRLKAANAGHRGLFLSWLDLEFEMSQATAYRFMQIAARFAEDELLNLRSSSISALYELAGAETSVVEQVREGQIPLTREAIREAKATQSQAEQGDLAEERAEEQARERLRLQETQIKEFSEQIAGLHQHIASLQERSSSVQVVETVVEREVVPPEMLSDLARLQEQVSQLQEQREALLVRIERLGAHNRAEFLERNDVARHQLLRQQWRSVTLAWEKSTSELSAHWPTLLDTESFGQEEWTALHHMKEAAGELIERCEKLIQARAMIVDAQGTGL